MPKSTPLSAESRDGFMSTLYIWLVMGFFAGLTAELAILGFPGLMNASMLVVFAIPMGIGAAMMGLVWLIHRRFGTRGVVLASWSGVGMYGSMFVCSLVLRLFLLWRFTMPIILTGMAVGLILGLVIGLRRVSVGNYKLHSLFGSRPEVSGAGKPSAKC